MAFEQRHSNELNRYHAKFGLPAYGDDGSAARAWTYKLAEQFEFTFPGEHWGTKSTTVNHPQSTDVICRPEAGILVGYDVIIHQGSPNQFLDDNPSPINLTGQTYVDVRPHDHIGGATPTPKPPPIISRDEFYARFKEVDAFYGANDGLKRPGNMVIDTAVPPRSDHEAMGKWGYDLMLGKSVADCKAEIRQSQEWRDKHPGETP
jgi:hypothetical protein